jgi:hypothetical protein
LAGGRISVKLAEASRTKRSSSGRYDESPNEERDSTRFVKKAASSWSKSLQAWWEAWGE